jgi:hypothetical protein
VAKSVTSRQKNLITLLGFAASSHAAALAGALAGVPGPRLITAQAAAVTAFAQQGASPRMRDTKRHLTALAGVQRRLEVACLSGPFLPADPAHAVCALADLQPLLAEEAEAIRAALAGPGTCHQWDVVLRWRPEAALASCRDAVAEAAAGGGAPALAEAVRAALGRVQASRAGALRTAMAAVSLAVLEAGAGQGEAGLAEAGVTVLIPAGREAELEAALQALPDSITAGVTADLRGPLPPVSFAAMRVDRRSAREVALAWRMLDLPPQADAETLRARWRATAQRLHPDHGAPDGAPMGRAAGAMRLLRGLLPAQAGPASLAAAQDRARARLRLCATEIAWP